MSKGQLGRVEQTTIPQPLTRGQLSRVELLAALSADTARGRLSRAEMLVPGEMTASAGKPQTDVEPWTTITLTGSAIGGDPPVTYKWRQISGATATLSATSTATVTFTAPGTLAGSSLVFGLIVSDDGYQPSPEATVQVDVLPVVTRAVAGGKEVPLRLMAVAS